MKQCHFCTNSIRQLDYKNTETLLRFTDSYGRIGSGRRTGVCSRHQRKLAQAIKRARFFGLLPFVSR